MILGIEDNYDVTCLNSIPGDLHLAGDKLQQMNKKNCYFGKF